MRNRFCVINCWDEPLLLRQEGTAETSKFTVHVFTAAITSPVQNLSVEIPPRGKTAYNWASNSKPLRVLFKLKESTGWAFGGCSLGEVGSTAVWLPPEQSGVIEPCEMTVLLVDICIAEKAEDSATNVVIRKGKSPFSVMNNSLASIAVRNQHVYN